MNYIEKLRASSDTFHSIVCLGLDPVLADIPIQDGGPRQRIYNFYESILNALLHKKIYPAAVKPNYAFYAQYGLEGIACCADVIALYRNAGLPVILDVKRGDIGSTADAYSREAFDFFNADAVTLSPYMGYDSIEPFIKNYPSKGYYILNKTSNKSSADIQDIMVEGRPMYLHVASKIAEWHKPGIGAVVGATYPEQLGQIAEVFVGSGKDIPLLIPGVGTQGGSVKDVCKELTRFSDVRIHRINSSRAINYAYKKYSGLHFADAAAQALKTLNDEINSLIFQ